MIDEAERRIAILEGQIAIKQWDLSQTELGNYVVNGELQNSVPLPEHLTSSAEWRVHRSPRNPCQLTSQYPAPYDGIATLYDIFEKSVAEYAEAPFLGTRGITSDGKPGPYSWMTYEQAAKARTLIGAGLLHYGLQQQSKVGLCSVNCRDWMLVDLACQAYNLVPVPLYDTLGPDVVEYILGHADIEAVACSAAVLGSILEVLPGRPNVKLVVVYNWSRQQILPPSPSGSATQVITLEDLQRIGAKHPRVHEPPGPEDLALICYTSGTTGVPKGAMISHSNVVASGVNQTVIAELQLRQSDVHISYLPLAHIYERATVVAAMYAGAAIGFYRGDILTLLDDIQELKPTVFASVPRLYTRIYDKVLAAMRDGNAMSRALFSRAYAYKQAALARGDLSGGKFGPFWDKLVFSKVQARLGGRIRLMISGGSPARSDVLDFLRICFGAIVVEGYGLTETTSACSATMPEEHRTGHVGGPGPAVEIKLTDVPEMKYTNADKPFPRGEICVRGFTVFKGYFKDETNTAEAIDKDGWFHTGDVGTWISGGRLQIIDRKKAMFKLAQGEYVAAEKIENVLMRSALVSQAFVYGDSLQTKLVAIVVPDPDTLLPWAAARHLTGNLEELCKNASVRQTVLKSMQEEGRAAKLRGFEQVAAVYLTPEPFTADNNLQTPTFKLKRPQAKERFMQHISEMYSALSSA